MVEDPQLQVQSLGIESWRVLAEVAPAQGTCILDLSQIEEISPAGAVAMLLFAKGRLAGGNYRCATRVILPERRSGEFKRIERVDLIHLLRFHSQVRFIPHQKADMLPPVPKLGDYTKTLINESPHRESVEELMRRSLKKADPQREAKLLSVFEEVLNNINDHAGSASRGHKAPFHCVQMQQERNEIEIAFGDLGMGFRDSLARNPDLPEFPSQEAAIHAAIEQRVSGLGHEIKERGGGLARSLENVRELGGSYSVLSRDGITGCHSGDTPGYESLPYAFPATMVWVRMPLH